MSEERILVIRFGRLGDLILAAAATRELKRAFPQATVDFAVREDLASAAALLPGIDRIAPLKPGGGGGVLALRAALPAEGYGRVLDLQGNFRSRILALLAGGGRTTTYPRRSVRRRLLLRGLGNRSGGEPVWRRYLRGVERLGAKVRYDLPRIREVSEAGVPGAVAFAPGAGRATKRWPEEHFAEAIQRCAAEHGAETVLIGSAGEEGLLRRIAAAAGVDARIAAGEPLERTAALLRDAAVLVTNDSGLLHLAEAAGTPVIALFGPTVAAFGFAPCLPESVLLGRDLPCRPCSLHGGPRCPRPALDHACLKEIGADPVVAAIGRFVVWSRTPGTRGGCRT